MTQTATLAGGCFWCLEAVYRELKGVERVQSGYANGRRPNPTYQQVCTGTTGHAEVVQIEFDPAVITFRDLLDVFFTIHDPTTLDRQGNDVGTQYRSAIFPQDAEQERQAREAIERANREQDGRVVTTIEPKAEWYPAEDYHQDYWAGEGQRSPYCLATIPPKLQKLRKSFQARAKSAAATA
jgi:peptide-methionine (S)-S-oxide reductase